MHVEPEELEKAIEKDLEGKTILDRDRAESNIRVYQLVNTEKTLYLYKYDKRIKKLDITLICLVLDSYESHVKEIMRLAHQDNFVGDPFEKYMKKAE